MMTFSLAQILGFTVTYLSVLFAIGYLADRGRISERITSHPAVYVLSLGVFAGTMAINGSLEIAYHYGYSFLLYYLGAVLMFVLSPLLLYPVYRVCRLYQLGSLADLLAFRFRSKGVGALATVILLLALLPLLAMQIQVVSDSILILAGSDDYLVSARRRPDVLALLFCAIITAFTILFGSGQLGAGQQHRGLVTAIAFESLLKLIAMLLLGAVAVHSVFGGFAGLDQWLQNNPQVVEMMNSPLRQDSTRGMLLIFFTAAIVMPHMFHMAITENPGGGRLRIASWGLPLYLLLLSLPVLPITWAALELDSQLPRVYGALAIGLEQGSTSLTLYAFLAALSAASAVIIVSTLALANMCLNHLVLPAQLHRASNPLNRGPDIYRHLRWLRRVLIAAIILAGYLFYRLVSGREPMVSMGMAAFTGTLQFLPATVAAIYWPGANKQGLVAGLLAGFATWCVVLLLPMVSDFNPDLFKWLYSAWFEDTESRWNVATFVSLAMNIGSFMLVSMLTPTSEEERITAEICSMDDLNRPLRQTLGTTSPQHFEAGLTAVLGKETAEKEVRQALAELQLDVGENRPFALRQLRARLEANLSGLLGPAVAYELLQRCVPLSLDTRGNTEDISLIEQRLDNAKVQFTGMAADLDNLRRYHRETLHKLPIGVLSLDRDGEVLMWNRFMEELTGISADLVIGSYLDSLPPAWSDPLQSFATSGSEVQHRLQIRLEDVDCWVSLHKAAVASSSRESEDLVIVVEDLSDYQLLEDELLHSERLASIGRLAAGVAHEIGNPVTGISSLAQNLAYEDDPEAVQAAASDILRQTERVTRIVESLVNFSHTGRVHGAETALSPLNLADCVDEAIHLLQLDHTARPVQFHNRCNREHLVMGDSQKLLQVFVNLLGNARDASSPGESVDIDSHDDGQYTHITVTDRGSGIAAEIQGQIFEPFFTTKDTGEGTGLGLALVYSILEELQARIQVESPVAETGLGTRFSLKVNRGEYQGEYE